MQNSQSAQPLPDIFIGTEKVNTMVEKYQSEKYPLLQTVQAAKGSGRTETKSVWFSKEHVQTWLSEMELMNANGMRVYFGAYEEDHPVAPGQQCLVVMLTRLATNGTGNIDIIYENEADFEDRQNATANSRDTSFDEKPTPKPFNYGSPCPPIC
jgi:hypothetical protein